MGAGDRERIPQWCSPGVQVENLLCQAAAALEQHPELQGRQLGAGTVGDGHQGFPSQEQHHEAHSQQHACRMLCPPRAGLGDEQGSRAAPCRPILGHLRAGSWDGGQQPGPPRSTSARRSVDVHAQSSVSTPKLASTAQTGASPTALPPLLLTPPCSAPVGTYRGAAVMLGTAMSAPRAVGVAALKHAQPLLPLDATAMLPAHGEGRAARLLQTQWRTK